LTVPVVTLPFFFEGKRRMQAAQEIIAELLALQLSPIVIPCNGLDFGCIPRTTAHVLPFRKADEALCTAVQGLTDPILRKGLIGYDFADHKAVLSFPGIGAAGASKASGPSRAHDAAMQAISSPLLEGRSIEAAQGVLLHITAGADCAIDEIAEAASLIQEATHEDAFVFFTCCVDQSFSDEMQIIVTAIGFPAPTGFPNCRTNMDHFVFDDESPKEVPDFFLLNVGGPRDSGVWFRTPLPPKDSMPTKEKKSRKTSVLQFPTFVRKDFK
jgi:cell division protein FtsZ